MAARHYKLQIRFQDIDSYGHVNNGALVTYLETARVYLAHDELSVPWTDVPVTLSKLRGEENINVVVDQYIEYRKPLRFRTEPVEVSIWVTRIGRSSFDYGYEIREQDNSEIYAVAHSGLVMVSRATEVPVPLTPSHVSTLDLLSGDLVNFRRFDGLR